MDFSIPIIAGTISTVIFVCSELPMLMKAFRTKNLTSYSLGNILLANSGNVIYSAYVFHLPPGPIWLMHTFYLTTTGMMLAWYLRYEWRPRRAAATFRALARPAPIGAAVPATISQKEVA